MIILIEVLAKGGNLVEHIHLPVQSGSTEVLKRMSRKYNREHYLKLADKIKTGHSGCCVDDGYYCWFSGGNGRTI